MELMRVPAGKFLMGSTKENKSASDDERPRHTVDIPYDYWMARYPITNELYNAYARSKGIKHPVSGWEKKKDHPVVEVSWKDALIYCQWLNNLLKAELPSGLVLRLPTEAEWEKAARWKPSPSGRGQGQGEALEYPWGNTFDKNNCNTYEGGKGGTTPVGLFSPQGDSPYGCADMSGNVWEWTHSLMKAYPYNIKDGREDEKASGARVLRGGSFNDDEGLARCACRLDFDINLFNYNYGFRVVASPVLS
jgi:formylglycine-generating enzyme required for sulfatase activity